MADTGRKDPAGAGARAVQGQEGGSGLEGGAFDLKFILVGQLAQALRWPTVGSGPPSTAARTP